MSEKGYVYILTNPSFKENWIKIGMTSLDPNARAADLSSATGVPLPFEVYAYMCTEHFKKAELLIHRMIDRFTKTRINKSREFFNIEPCTALEIFHEVADAYDDAEVVQVTKSESVKVKKTAKATSVGEMWQEYWAEFKRYISVNAPDLMRFKTHTSCPQNWYDISVGRKYCHITIAVSIMHKRLRMGIWAHDNKEVQDLLASKKDVFEKAMDLEMKIGGGKNLSMYAYKDFDVTDRKSWHKAFAWYLEKFTPLRDAIRSVVKQ